MNCWHCSTELIWGGDHDYEDYDMEGEGIVSNLSCPNCHSFVLVYMPIENDDEKLKEQHDEAMTSIAETRADDKTD